MVKVMKKELFLHYQHKQSFLTLPQNFNQYFWIQFCDNDYTKADRETVTLVNSW